MEVEAHQMEDHGDMSRMSVGYTRDGEKVLLPAETSNGMRDITLTKLEATIVSVRNDMKIHDVTAL